MIDAIVLDTVMVRTNKLNGTVVATIYTTDNDLTDGLEGSGLSLAEALHELSINVDEATPDA